MAIRKVFEDTLKVESVEDGGAARICRVDDMDDFDRCMFVRIQSYDERGFHNEIREFEGKRVRVTIEVIE